MRISARDIQHAYHRFLIRNFHICCGGHVGPGCPINSSQEQVISRSPPTLAIDRHPQIRAWVTESNNLYVYSNRYSRSLLRAVSLFHGPPTKFAAPTGHLTFDSLNEVYLAVEQLHIPFNQLLSLARGEVTEWISSCICFIYEVGRETLARAGQNTCFGWVPALKVPYSRDY